jgi:hypothetical protein
MHLHEIRGRWAVLVALMITLLTACSGTTDGHPGSCGLTARLEGRAYAASGGMRVIPRYGVRLGTAIVPSCEDEGAFRIEAFAIVGISPDVAFASPRYEEAIFVAEAVKSLPPGLERLRREPTCIAKDSPIHLHGPWLGIIGPGNKTEVDLVPPYDLEMRVDRASVERYERVFLTIHVAKSLGQPLRRDDVRSSLWQGGDLSLTATCVDDEFWAERVTASLPR